jgi:translation elongation factor EF-G
MQIPIGLEADHQGVVDLVTMKALYFDGANGEIRRVEDIPQALLPEAQKRRQEMLDAASMYSDELLEAALDGERDAGDDPRRREAGRDQPPALSCVHGLRLQEQGRAAAARCR